MNLVDIIILSLLAAALINGVRQGAATQVLSFGGFVAGLAAGAALAPLAARAVDGAILKAAVSFAVTFGMASLISTLGRIVGARIWGLLKSARLGGVDSVAGGAFAVGASTFVIWTLISMLASVPIPPIADGIHDSKVVQVMTERLPPAPALFARLRKLFDAAGFPQVFAELEPSPGPSVAPPNEAEFRATVAAGRASTVRIVGFGCGGRVTGSGFVAAPGLVVTNAHVVAGIDNPVIQDSRGSHRSRPVVFDPKLDIAVLRADGLAGRPLPLDTRSKERGQGGAVLGFPGGGGFSAGPGSVMAEFDAVGRDIYSSSVATRHVYQLQADVKPGNSGGPFVIPGGAVAGVIFSRSATNDNVAYAITASEVAPRLQEARTSRGADTGECAA